MLGLRAMNVLRSSSFAFSGRHSIVTVVLPPASVKVVRVSISAGQVGAIGWRVMFPSASENELTRTRRSGGTISRYTHFPHSSYAVFCLKKKKTLKHRTRNILNT